MNPSEPTPPPATPSPPRPAVGKKPVVVVSAYGRREIVAGIVTAVILVALLIYAVMRLGGEQSENRLLGVVESHYQTGEKETLLDVSHKGVKSKTADTGFYLKVRVDKENRTYDVMVSEEDWNKYHDGDTIHFLRPPSEQH
jgi:hypothetical protein